MSDLISRQELCDDLREYKLHLVPISSDESEIKGYNDGIDLAISVIADFPSAEPERKWIPVTEALPEDIDRLLVTIVRSDGSKRVRSGHYYKGYFMLDNGDIWNETDKEILAWMPLAAPYGGE